MYYEVYVLAKFATIWNGFVGYRQYYVVIISVKTGNETFRNKWSNLFGRKVYDADNLLVDKFGCRIQVSNLSAALLDSYFFSKINPQFISRFMSFWKFFSPCDGSYQKIDLL